jgi:environmental stress-induced protein Ves
MTLIRAQDCPLVPWKNGMGRTRELAVYPAGAGVDDFIWRVSIAEVDSAAPFSRFPGIDRHIVLLDGAGFDMNLEDGQAHALRTPLEPFAFAGETGVDVTLVDGATRDFNVMLRRDRAQGGVELWQGPANTWPAHDVVLLFCARGACLIGATTLTAGDAWFAQAPIADAIRVNADAAVLAVHVSMLSSAN